MEIRQATDADTESVGVLARKALHLDQPWFVWTRDEKIRAAVWDGNVAVAVEDGRLAGFVWMEQDEEDEACLTIEALAVEDGLRGKGIGRRLVAHAVETARSLGAARLAVGSFLEYGVRPFYEACGFRCLGQELWNGEHPFWWFEMEFA
jgi:GNAT superfamily N-acetyltransferase